MNKKWLVASTGFALFSMFFGSGNLVFPITVGLDSGGHSLLAALGILTTGVFVPFLGVFGMLLYKGDLNQFFSCFGKKGVFLFSFLALSLMGPFGVLARCLTVAHGALLLLSPSASLPLVSFGFCVLIFLLTINKSKIVSVLGSILTPFFLLAIGMIVFLGFSRAEIPASIEGLEWNALKNGFFQGYQTMDLLAAFFFSGFVISHLFNHGCTNSNNEKEMLKIFLKSSWIGGGLLSIVYVCLVYLGWLYSPFLIGQPPQEMLGIIALESLGVFAAPCVCIAVILACMTTAVVLTSLFADFLRKEIAQERIGSSTALIVTLTIGFLVSTLDFAGIARFLGPILELIYPALIVLTVVNIANKLLGAQATHWPFTLTIAAKLCLA